LADFDRDFKGTMRVVVTGMAHEKTDAELKEWLVTRAEAQDPKMALALMRDLFGLDTVTAFKQAKVPVRCINSAGGYQFFTQSSSTAATHIARPIMGWSAVLQPDQQAKLAGGATIKQHAMSQKLNSAIAVIGIDIGKNSFHVIGQDKCGAIVLRQKWLRGQVEARLANLQPCLIGMVACVGAHHLSRKLRALGHDARLMPAKYARPLGAESMGGV
jgi:hypothetical protein